jgi:DNA-binding LacI/PurR family transcriptional regulator
MTKDTVRVTIRDVAREAGVSTTTVSRYLNNAAALDGKTYERVTQAIDRIGYVPSMMARSLKSQQSRMILLFVPDICNPFYSKMAKTVQQMADEQDYAMVLVDTEESVRKELSAIMMARQIYASGIMAASICASERVIKLLKDCGVPVVGLNSYPESSPFDVVRVHRTGGTNLAVKHLVELGHRDIVFAGGAPGTVIAESRRNGYLHAMNKAGIPLRQDAVYEVGFDEKDGYQAGVRFASLGALPTAICCANDLIAFGVVHALNDRGIQVPQAVSVTGMDDIMYASISSPKLTTVTNDGALFAREAFDMLVERIDKRYKGPPRHIEISNMLVTRESTGAPRTMRQDL